VKKIEFGEFTMFLSDQAHLEHRLRAMDDGVTTKHAIRSVVHSLFFRRIHEDVVPFFARWRAKHKGVAILNAHGSREKTIWHFSDGCLKTVQSWLDEVDGKYGTVVLLVCDEPWLINPPTTRKSLLFYPDGIVSSVPVLGDSDDGELHHYEAVHPTYGEINGYTVEHATEKLLATR
jgi:hypothetical protein